MTDFWLDIILGVIIVAYVGLGIFYLWLRYVNRKLDAALANMLQQLEERIIPLEVELDNGQYYVYNQRDKQFICQGRDLAEIKAAMKLRFPERVAYLAGGDEDLVKELREQLVKAKVEGILAEAEKAQDA